jgi:hypothetical protein
MDHTYLDEKSLKTLEDYAVLMVTGIMTLTTLQNLQVRAIELGIMKEDMNERANTIIWDIRRLLSHYKNQSEATLELVGDSINVEAIVDRFKKDSVLKRKRSAKKVKAIEE